MRHTLASLLVTLFLVTHAAQADQTLAFYLSRSDLVIACEIVKEPAGVVSAIGVTHWICPVKVTDLIKGSVSVGKQIDVSVERIDGTGGVPEKGHACILFLEHPKGAGGESWETADIWFGIQPFTKAMAGALRTEAYNMQLSLLHEFERKQTPEHLRGIIQLTESPDKEIVRWAIEALSQYRGEPEVVAVLQKAMKESDYSVALEAAATTCRILDWSGLDMLLEHLDHTDAKVRCKAARGLAYCGGSNQRERIVARMLARLAKETDVSVLDRVIETIEFFPSKETLLAVKPLLTHANERVRGRAEMTERRIAESLQR